MFEKLLRAAWTTYNCNGHQLNWSRANFSIITVLVVTTILQPTFEICPEELSLKGVNVTWHETSSAKDIVSEPPCYHEQHLITRQCNNTKWIPALDELRECSRAVESFDLLSCPPGFHRISESNKDFCYQVSTQSKWDYPCFKSGGASVITDLNADDIVSLLDSLNKTQKSKFFWLPAQRAKIFNPVVWFIPGPNWGQQVDTNTSIRTQMHFFKNCLLLDIEQRAIVTETCSKEYPSLCFYLNDLHYPAKCPHGYHAFRFMPDNGTCFGIEHSDNTTGLSYDKFIETKCDKPMTESNLSLLSRFIFMKVAQLNMLPDNMWCWFQMCKFYNNETYVNEKDQNNSIIPFQKGIINNKGYLSLLDMSLALPCMACETDMVYEEATLALEYDNVKGQLYLTIYFPSGLWKYDNNDKGIQCFSDAKGFVKVINVSDTPFIKVESLQPRDDKDIQVEKTVYVINLITDRSAQYWCEGHTKNFSLVSTTKIIANPQGNSFHVFALFIIMPVFNNDQQDIQEVCDSIVNITATVFHADKVLLMDIFEHTMEHMLVLLHLHIAINGYIDDEGNNLKNTYNDLRDKADLELPKYNITFVNISSSVYCLPTFSDDFITLDWELTMIGTVAVPKQFCLQVNGLPVTRNCYGSYNAGGFWGEVIGNCNKNYEPSSTTTFLYNFMKRQTPENFTSTFLTDGLGFVLDDVNIIIPADIYYLSMSLQYVKNIAQENQTYIDMGDIENMAWVMDRVMILNNNYLRLAQTLNSTNIILDSVNDIIEMLAEKKVNTSCDSQENSYQLAVMPQFLVQISYPEVNNITGIALVRKTKSDNMFTDMIIQPLFKNTTLESILSIENLEIATWIPDEVLDTLRKKGNDSNDESIDREKIHILISIFQNDAVFQQLDMSKHIVNSRILGVSIPGFISNLEHSVTLVFKEINKGSSLKFCGYWEFHTKKTGNNPGFWTNNGCYYVKSIKGLAICKCYHMTHFGQLLDIGGVIKADDYKNRKPLNIITLVGSFLSLLGVSGIWITALVFQNWRKKAGTKVLLQLSTAISIPLLFIVLFNFDSYIFIENEGIYAVAKNMETACIILGALLHYSVLASFMWMLITAILQFVRYVRVLGVRRPSRFMIKFALIGWGIPSIPVGVILAINRENYIPDPSVDDTFKGICYPNGFYLIVGVIVPICVILVINITLFVLVIYAISRGNGKMRATDIDIVGAQLRLSIFLFFLLGLTWVFGLFSFTNNLLWSYLFCLTSSLQGFVLFIYFIICDPMTRNLWISVMKPQFFIASSRDSVSSISVS